LIGLRWFERLSIRHKLLALVLVPLALVLPLLGIVLLVWLDAALDQVLITKIRSDLAVAQGYFERVLGEVSASTVAVAESAALDAALPGAVLDQALPEAARDPQALTALLARLRARERLDLINLRAPDGSLLYTDNGRAGSDDAGSPANAAAAGDGRAGVEILSGAQLALLAPGLIARVPVALVPTRNAAPTERSVEDRAMVLLATHAVRASDGRVRAWLQGGVLLNRNLPFIDHINEIVYPEGALPFGSRGTATLFLDDVRISTNVRLFADAAREDRAIGTRVSMAVREAVLGAGRTWLDRAFVVNDWYVSAYQPLADANGARVGMLYVGFSEAPFRWFKWGVLASIGLMFIAVMASAAIVSLRWARSIFRPVEAMAATMQRVQAGDLSARVGNVQATAQAETQAEAADELGTLAGHLNRLLDAISAHTAELDAKVAERTADLRAAQSQLVRSEKLAAVGQLTASIAHEVNNPIAVIQGNLDLLRELLGAEAVRVAAELKLVDEQIERMRLIVTKLLQFARPAEFAGYVEPVDTARALDDCLVLAGHQLARTGIVVEKRYAATRWPPINRTELQQVFVNLIVNAIHAMPEGGTLTLASCDEGDEGDEEVRVDVIDTGPGLSAAVRDKLFQPFVTSKHEGTGLGLWISRGLVERYGGDVRAGERQDGARGAQLTVILKMGGAA
jgi:two-component system, NtrC family, sensor kinase